MTRDEAIAIIAARLGNRSGLSAQGILEIQLAQTELEHDAELRPWFLKDSNDQSVLAVNSNLVIPAVSFLVLQDTDTPLFYQDTAALEWLPIEVKDEVIPVHSAAEAAAAELETGPPKQAQVVATGSASTASSMRLVFFPFPDQSYTIRILAYFPAAVLTTNGQNTWLAHAPDLLISKTGMRMARFLRDPSAVKLFESDYLEARARLTRENTEREQRGTEVFIGER